MPYYSQETIQKCKEMDLLTYLRNYEPQELVRISCSTYSTKTHDSLKISNGKWMWWSRGIGGVNAVDYLIKVKGLTFIEAISVIAERENLPASTPYVRKKQPSKLILPPKSESNDIIKEYLKARSISDNVINYCIDNGYIYQCKPMNNIAFVGFNKDGEAKYICQRSVTGRFFCEVAGSDKAYSFRLTDGKNNNLHIFEGAVDLLSYATLLEMKGSDFKSQNLLSLSGVYKPSKEKQHLPKALSQFFDDHKNISTVYLHLDNDYAGRIATKTLTELLKPDYEVICKTVPFGKDVNDYLCRLSSPTKQYQLEK